MQRSGAEHRCARSHRLELLAGALSSLQAIGEPTALAQSVADLLTATSVVACQIDLDAGGALTTAAWSRNGEGGPSHKVPDEVAADAATSGLVRVAADPASVVTWAALPLVVRRRTLGTLSVALGPDDPDLHAADLVHFERIATALAAALARGEDYARAMEVSRSLQQSLLPTTLPVTGWVTITGRYLAATAGMDVGGDWYDAQLLAGGELALSVGDAAGHGVEAAARMGEVRSAISTLRLLSRAPDELISLLHRVSGASGYFATAVCGRLRQEGVFVWSSAGHLPPILLRPDETTVLYEAQSPPLGTGYSGAVKLNQRLLHPGDAIFLYTDGLVERRDEAIDVSVDRLVEHLAGRPGTHPEELIDHVIGARQAAGPTTDDIAVLVARYDGPSSEQAPHGAVTPPS